MNDNKRRRTHISNLSPKKPVTQEQIKERIKFMTETYKTFILLIITVGGGLVSLIIKDEKTDIEFTVLRFGIVIFVVILGLTIYMLKDIRSLIKKLS